MATIREFFFGQPGDPPDKRVPMDWAVMWLTVAGGAVILSAFLIWFARYGIWRLLDCQ